jgi:GTP cyclohydrolase II
MNEVQTHGSSALFGGRRYTTVSRGFGEFHGRRPVSITAKGETMLALPVEGLDRPRLAEFMALCGPVEPQLIITERRHMLRILNCSRIVLLTNNPAKLDGLTKAGIEIASRMPLDAPINADNRRYMTAKAARVRHRFDHLVTVLADQS